MKRFSKGEAIRFGWETTKKNFWFFFFLALIIAAVSAVSAVLSVIGIIAGVIVQMGIIRILLKFTNNEKPHYDELFYYKPFLSYFFSSLLYGVIVTVGFILLIVPGIIFTIKLQFFSYYIIDKNLGPVAALQKSWEATKGIKWNLFVFGLMLLGVNILGALALGIGLFVTVPTTMLATAFVYSKLSSK